MLPLAAFLAGFGGLLLEMLFVRRHGLLIGNTASASALVLALFLLGLGVGGLWLTRLALARRRPLGFAAILYAGVALCGVAGDLLLAHLPPLATAQGAALAVVVPGLPAVLMGGAFPLLFAALPRHATPRRAAVLVGANLAGSVLATFVGGNFAIPTLGMQVCAWIGAGAYAVTALLVAVASRFGPRTVDALPPPLRPVGRAEVTALASGFVVLAFEVLMLRRLPFFLDGFQPTLSGVLAACLLGLTLGAFVGPALLRALCGARAAPASVLFGVAAAAIGLQEWAAPVVGRMGVGSDLGFHFRIVAAALVAAGLPCFFLGATVPLCLERFVHPETRAPLAGRLFFFQGVGSLVGALLVGQALPGILPTTFFSYGVPVVLAAGAVLVFPQAKRATAVVLLWVVAAGAAGLTSGTAFRHDPAPVAGSRYDRPDRYEYLEHRSDEVLTASVVYDRRAHGLILFTDEFRAAYIDKDSGYMKVLGHLPFLLRENLRRVAVVALGTGTTANAVQLWPDPEELHVVEISEAVVSLVHHFAKDGPGVAPVEVPFLTDRRTRVHVTDGRRFVARRAPASLDLISMEPLLPYAPGTVPLYTQEFYRLCARALSDHGLMVQWVPTHSMPEEYFRTLLATFARGFRHHSVWLLNHSTLLIGSKRPHLPPIDELRARMHSMPERARRDLHVAGLATANDLAVSMVGTDVLGVCDAPDLRDDRPFLERLGYWGPSQRFGFLPDNLGVLRQVADRDVAWPGTGPWRTLRVDRLQGLRDLSIARAEPATTHNALGLLGLSRARDRLPTSVLLYGEWHRARRELAEKQFPAGRGATDLARLRRHLAEQPDSALLWAVLAARTNDDAERGRAVQNALVLDPTVYDLWPQLRVRGVPSAPPPGPFEAIAVLPAGEDLLRLAADTAAAGLAFRARFRVRIGHACLGQLADRPLRVDELQTFRAVLDPALLDAALRAVVARGGDVAAEILPLWRRDLELPRGLAVLLEGSVGDRRNLAVALRGRRSGASRRALARLLLDDELSVRRAASVSLFQSFGDAVEYDPESTVAERRRAVEEFRRLQGAK